MLRRFVVCLGWGDRQIFVKTEYSVLDNCTDGLQFLDRSQCVEQLYRHVALCITFVQTGYSFFTGHSVLKTVVQTGDSFLTDRQVSVCGISFTDRI